MLSELLPSPRLMLLDSDPMAVPKRSGIAVFILIAAFIYVLIAAFILRLSLALFSIVISVVPPVAIAISIAVTILVFAF